MECLVYTGGQVEGKSCIGIFVLNKHMVGTKRVRSKVRVALVSLC
jgi:hypothetical protein